MYIELLGKSDTAKRYIWHNFLKKAGLEPDAEVTQTVLLWDGEALVAVGSRQDNLLKCIAVEESRKGEDLTSVILSALRKDAFAEGFRHLFLYTKPENESMFSSLFFYTVAKTDKVLLMENQKNGIKDFLESINSMPVCEQAGAIVMNCNPFTLGHRYLIETAAKECERLYVFVVSENKSRFSFEHRLEMVRRGVADIDNVSVLPTGPYLVSSATFPTYFLKQRENVSEIQCLLDIEIFTRYFAPKFSIKCRYVGTEPMSPMTNQYNNALKENLPKHGIEIKEIPRLHISGEPISASTVRQLIDKGDTQKVKALVPHTTFDFLKTNGLI